MSVKTVYKGGRTEIDGRAFLDYAVRKTFTYSDLATGVIKFPVDSGKHLLGIRLHITEGFAGATSAKIGDSTDDDGYMTVGDLTQTNVRLTDFVLDSRKLTAITQSGTTPFAVTVTPNAYALGGKFYSTPSYIVFTLAGTATAGAAVLEFLFDGYEAAKSNMISNQ